MSNQNNDALPVVEGQEENGRDTADYLSFRPGQRLRKARELRGMSIDQVARELALSPRYVEAMESDVYKDLPEPAFVRGYMRRYAQLVKLSADDIAAKFDQCYAEDKETPPLEVRPSNPVQLLGVLARGQRHKSGRLLSWIGILFIVVLVAGVLWNGMSSRIGGLPATEAPAPGETAAPGEAAPVTAVPEAVVPGVPGSLPATVAPAPATQPPVPATQAPAATVQAPAPATTPPAPPATQAPVPATRAPVPLTRVPSTQPPAATATPGMNVLPSPSSPPVLPAPGARAVPVPVPSLQPAPAPAPQPAR